jgi:hypothetical protein
MAYVVGNLLHTPRRIKEALGKRRLSREMQFCDATYLWCVPRKLLFDPPLDISARPFVHFHRQRCMPVPASTNRGFWKVLVEDQTAQVLMPVDGLPSTITPSSLITLRVTR